MDNQNLEIDGFEWDVGNFEKNLKKHGVSIQEIEEVFLNAPLMIFSDAKHSADEERFIAFGATQEKRSLTIAFTMRSKDGLALVRPISARPMHRKERKIYEEAIAEIKES
ncbi:MAG: BrnT family toxin [Deltaproteobacteria bacterium]|nr:MAG: BrnT family toxin [Deltaproteobacteria bacterium]